MGVLIGIAIGIPIAAIMLVIRTWLYNRNLPSGERKDHLLQNIVDMKRRGYGYAERLAYLRKEGLRKDVADCLLGDAERLDKKIGKSS